jgi:hypothetical protein
VSLDRAYPLGALLELRRAELDEAKARLAAAQRALTAREEATRAAGAVLEAHRVETSRLLEAFRAGGVTSASELGRRDAYRRRRVEDERALAAQLALAEEAEREASHGVELARAALGDARAQLEAVEKDEARHRVEVARHDEARAEADIEDLVGRRRSR